MSRRYVDPQFDLFLPYVADLPMRDQRETMERPFFALGKRKRSNPIEYTSPKGDIFVNVYPNPEFGMATIWDADILIWAASTLHNMRRKGVNDIPRTINFHPYDLLTTICRPTGGHQYRLLRGALSRLQATTIQTNIRARRNKKFRQFSWIEGYTEIIYEGTEESIGMSLTLSDWFYEGVMMEGGVLSLDPVYFTITGGRERWLYRVARKHAGGAGAEGFAISLRTLFEKSGAEGTFRRFKYEIQRIVNEDALPQFSLSLEGDQRKSGELALRMVLDPEALMAESASEGFEGLPQSAGERPPTIPVIDGSKARRKVTGTSGGDLPLFDDQLSEETLARIRADFPGWDIYSLKADFDAWLAAIPGRQPRDYQKAFYGFVRRQHRKGHGDTKSG